jgi:hypothetical protein
MSAATDHYRMDTPPNHRDGRWFSETWSSSGARRPLHLRGLHYAFVSTDPATAKPNGCVYRNTDDDWCWLQPVSNNARWFGYIAFEDTVDERNAPPVILTVDSTSRGEICIEHRGWDSVQPFDSLLPRVRVEQDMVPRQAYRRVLIGEKPACLMSCCRSRARTRQN